jgi:hypothetical protein
MIVLKRDYPAFLKPYSKQIKGISVGSCVCKVYDSHDIGKTDHAHAHLKPRLESERKEGPWAGWLCVRSLTALNNKPLMLHELAHLLTNEGHNDKWRRKLLKIGGTLKATGGRYPMFSYKKRNTRPAWLG